MAGHAWIVTSHLGRTREELTYCTWHSTTRMSARQVVSVDPRYLCALFAFQMPGSRCNVHTHLGKCLTSALQIEYHIVFTEPILDHLIRIISARVVENIGSVLVVMMNLLNREPILATQVDSFLEFVSIEYRCESIQCPAEQTVERKEKTYK